VSSVKDMFEFMGMEWVRPKKAELTGDQKIIFELIRAEARTGAELAEIFEGNLISLYAVLGELELQGHIRLSAGLRYTSSSIRS